MRLINTSTYELDEFFGEFIPSYAILSHTWGKPTDEVTYNDFKYGSPEVKEAYRKIQFLCEQAVKDDLKWAWCDTCCIDKSSSAELSESINSMYRWYKNGIKCYALLADVIYGSPDRRGFTIEADYKRQFRESKWFKRCWTLQELLAPSTVEFYSMDHVYLGDKTSLMGVISQITGISTKALSDNELTGISGHERLSWTQSREATREEDEAYSLFGIFRIHMPLIYGERRDNAFKRLHEEISKNFTPDMLVEESSEQLRLHLQVLLDQSDSTGTPPQSYTAAGNPTRATNHQPITLATASFQRYLASYNSGLAGAALQSRVDLFRASLCTDDKSYFDGTTFELLKRELMILQRDQDKRRVMMNLSRLKVFLERLYHLSKTIGVLNVPKFDESIWGPVKFIVLTTSTAPDAFETVLHCFEQIGNNLPEVDKYDTLCTVQQENIKIFGAVFDFYEQILDICRGSSWARLFKPMWKGYDTEFAGLLLRLALMTKFIKERVTMSHHVQYRLAMTENMARLEQADQTLVVYIERYEIDRDAIKAKFETGELAALQHYRQYEKEMTGLRAKIKQEVDTEKSKKRRNVIEWLALEHHAETDHERFQNVRRQYSTTAQWILDHENVTNWINADVPSHSILWMHGIPGAGKTILSSSVIDRCMQRAKFATCYFYCHEGDQSSNSALSILKGLISQLLEQHGELLPLCHTRRSLSGEPTLRSLHQARKLFEDCCFAQPNAFLIVDGLDECELIERKQAVEVLTAVVAQCNLAQQGTLRALFVSQEYVDIKKALHSDADGRLAPQVLKLLEANIVKDISVYVKFWVDKIVAKFPEDFTEERKNYLRDLTIENSKGMFLYAELVLQNLYQQVTREDLFTTVRKENFPKGLKGAYERILQRIKKNSPEEEWKKAKKLLGWMVCAKRQLTWKEIQVALSIDVDSQEIFYDDRRLRTHIHDICGSLVIITGDRVTLVHSTAKTFIINTSEGIHEPTIECELAALCLQYLTFPCFTNDEYDKEELEKMMLNGHFAFQDYAVAKWSHHVNAFVSAGTKFLHESTEPDRQLRSFSMAIDDFMTRYDDEQWAEGLLQVCVEQCKAFEDEDFFENLLLLTSHIYTFQEKGFHARNKISIKSLESAIKRNRKLLEEFPSAKTSSAQDKKKYFTFYHKTRYYKCDKITCRYFSEGFGDEKARKRHINIHDRPFHCEVADCLGAEGFANPKDLEKHTRSFHPSLYDQTLLFSSVTEKYAKAVHACTLCGKTFTRRFHQRNHELSHRGERPHACPECGKAFTRKNDMERHRRLHERGR